MNTNCLEGFKCPSCGNEDGFYIAGSALFHVTDDGTSTYEEVEWEDDSFARCAKCGREADVSYFQGTTEEKKSVLKTFEVSAYVKKRYTTTLRAVDAQSALKQAENIRSLIEEGVWDEDYEYYQSEIGDHAEEVDDA